jgi:hypothetical protein
MNQKDTYPIKIVEEDGVQHIFDGIRKRYVQLTPEEGVRQELIQWLIEDQGYPKTMFSVEKRIVVHEKWSRYDIVIYKSTEPWMLIECKRPGIILNMDTLLQSTVYQNALNADYIVLSNGEQTLCMDIQVQKWITEFPPYPFEV